jgi:hypothetical protein
MQYDKNFTLVVGTTETHTVSVEWDQMWGKLRVFVDGILVLRKRVLFEWSRVHRHLFVVGDEEPHQVILERERERLASSLRQQTFRVLVDGEPAGSW